ncbi:putative acetyl-CoA acetyltransferase, cytosolic 2 [Vitis vinifera]|uniref:Putative acetyl-CoA acetyltransferase, cytosolic 2 n=1 Tax=Vitis vinifera TaxID=29760 RepID=A0A438FJA5_VITVI|nr:putative acetyl-CoA acetyltransferase, cytosolic 2 [Vitis vinifera]
MQKLSPVVSPVWNFQPSASMCIKGVLEFTVMGDVLKMPLHFNPSLFRNSPELPYHYVKNVVVAGGMESMSNVPKYLVNAREKCLCTEAGSELINRNRSRLGHDTIANGMVKDGLWDGYNDFGMGICAEICADQHKITREEQSNCIQVAMSNEHLVKPCITRKTAEHKLKEQYCLQG